MTSSPTSPDRCEMPTPKPQLVELPARVYSVLTALLLIGVILVVLTFLRQH
jgi:hypothetical protein